MELQVTEQLNTPNMETVLLFANKKQDALDSVQALCIDIQKRDDANHKLYFAARLMGAFVIAPGEESDGQRHLTGNREVIIFPAFREEDFNRLKSTKNLSSIHNAKWLVGDGPFKIKRREKIIDWLLGKIDEIDVK